MTSTRFADRVGQGHGAPNYMKKDAFYSVLFIRILLSYKVLAIDVKIFFVQVLDLLYDVLWRVRINLHPVFCRDQVFIEFR